MKWRTAELLYTLFMLGIFTYTAIGATEFKKNAMYFPLYISILAIILLVIDLIRQFRRFKKPLEKDEPEYLHPDTMGVFKYSLVLAFYAVLIYLIGFLLASIIYLFGFLYFIARMRLMYTIITVTVVVVFIVSFGNTMNLVWPKSLISIL